MIGAINATAFVEELAPNTNGDGIPCHAIRAMLIRYIQPGGLSASELGGILEREFVPGGWTAQDNTDNSSLIALVNSKVLVYDKLIVALETENLCMLWESNVDEVDTPAEYRNALGINP